MLTTVCVSVKNFRMSTTLRPLTGAHLQCDTLPDLLDGLRLIAQELDEAGIRQEPDDAESKPRKLGHGPFLNAVLAWIMLMTPGQRRTFGRRVLPYLKTVRAYSKPRRDWALARDGAEVEEVDVILRALKQRPKKGLALNGDVRPHNKRGNRHGKDRIPDKADSPVRGE